MTDTDINPLVQAAAPAVALSRLTNLDSRYAPMGVFRVVQRPVDDQLMLDQLDAAAAKRAGDDDAAAEPPRRRDTSTIDE